MFIVFRKVDRWVYRKHNDSSSTKTSTEQSNKILQPLSSDSSLDMSPNEGKHDNTMQVETRRGWPLVLPSDKNVEVYKWIA
jgi:hypothetical protein